MALVEKHAPGSFCWTELATTDSAAAKSFYGGLFGWKSQDTPMGGGNFYTILTLQDRDTAGMYRLDEGQRAQGIPPHWMVYFAVADAAQTADEATRAGGKVIAGPFEVMEAGHMALLEDPTGARFAVWQAKAHHGARIENEIGAPSWPELATRDAAKAEAFYTRLFGWGAKTSKIPTPYTEWQLGERLIGGMIQMDGRWGVAPPHWMIYMMVKDCAAAAAKASSLGGQVCVPPTDIPEVGRFAVLGDPQGAVFAVIELSRPPA